MFFIIDKSMFLMKTDNIHLTLFVVIPFLSHVSAWTEIIKNSPTSYTQFLTLLLKNALLCVEVILIILHWLGLESFRMLVSPSIATVTIPAVPFLPFFLLMA